MNSITRKTLTRLGELHTAGVVLRNRGESKKFKKADRPAWRSEYDDWKKQVVDVLKKLHPGKAQRIQTVNRVPSDGVYRFWRARWFVGRAHQTDLRTFEKRLEILEELMYKELG
jgi:hypothetical protein